MISKVEPVLMTHGGGGRWQCDSRSTTAGKSLHNLQEKLPNLTSLSRNKNNLRARGSGVFIYTPLSAC